MPVDWVGEDAPGIELIQRHHRFALVAPSKHPSGRDYQWRAESPELPEMIGEGPVMVPTVDALPWLPDDYLKGLKGTAKHQGRVPVEDADLAAMLTDGEACEHVTRALGKYAELTGKGNACHGAVIRTQIDLLRLGHKEHPGVKAAVDTLRELFEADRGDVRDTDTEFDNALLSAVGKILAEPTPDDKKGCHPDQGDGTAPWPTLPGSFWETREVLRRIRRRAHERVESADAVLYAALARLSGMVPPGTRLDTGVGAKGGASLNLFIIPIGPPGAGKTSSVEVSCELFAPPPDMDFADQLPLGSGEGIAEAFMGWVQVPTGEVYKSGDNKGEEKLKWERKQVRGNAFVFADEGDALVKYMQRSGTTIAETIRRAMRGQTLGQQNADRDRTRIIPAGSYSLGIVLGFQPETVAPLLEDAPAGTPQRFVWCAADDPAIPDMVNGDPFDTGPTIFKVQSRMMTCAPEIQAEIRADLLARKRHQKTVASLDAHGYLTRAKLAGLLALLENRYTVTAEDWALAGVMWRTSCAARDRAVSHAKELEEARRQAQDDRIVQREARAQVARAQADGRVERLATNLARRVHDKGPQTRKESRGAFESKARPLYDEALEHAVGQSWVKVEDGKIVPGTSKPVTS